MTRMNIVLAAAALVFAAACFVLFKDANDQRDRVRALEAQVTQLQREITTNTTVSQPVADTPAPTIEPPAQAAPPPPAQRSTPEAQDLHPPQLGSGVAHQRHHPRRRNRPRDPP